MVLHITAFTRFAPSSLSQIALHYYASVSPKGIGVQTSFSFRQILIRWNHIQRLDRPEDTVLVIQTDSQELYPQYKIVLDAADIDLIFNKKSEYEKRVIDRVNAEISKDIMR